MTEERTEPASPRKLRLARERGEVPKSALLTAAAIVGAGAAWLSLGAPAMFASLRAYHEMVIADPLALSPRDAIARAGVELASAVALPLGLVVAVAALASVLQVGPLFAPRAVAPDLTRLDPSRGLARVLSPEALGRTAFSLLVVTILIVISWQPVREGLRALLGRPELDAPALSSHALAVLGALSWRAAAVLGVAGVLDAVWQRARFLRAQRMTRREKRREARETEGDPLARRRRAQLLRQSAMGPRLEEAILSAVLYVRGADAGVLIGWSFDDEPARVLFAARGAALAPLDRLARTSKVPRALDAALTAELARVRAGATVPRALNRRLARHLARHLARRVTRPPAPGATSP